MKKESQLATRAYRSVRFPDVALPLGSAQERQLGRLPSPSAFSLCAWSVLTICFPEVTASSQLSPSSSSASHSHVPSQKGREQTAAAAESKLCAALSGAQSKFRQPILIERDTKPAITNSCKCPECCYCHKGVSGFIRQSLQEQPHQPGSLNSPAPRFSCSQ